MKRLIMRILGSLTWLVTALAALHIGMVFWFGERADGFYYLMDKPYGIMVIKSMLWIIGVSGVVSLLMFVSMLFKKCCLCGCDVCSKAHSKK
jgi:hypothetical protein